jgi:hypothetical protein
MLGFRRRNRGGRHSLGAAVTAVPSGPRRVELPVALPLVPADPPSEEPFAGRVELGFRDGTCAALEPGSEQARALQELAGLLSGRQAPSGSSHAAFLPTPTE